MRKLALLLAASMLFASCASILNGSHQKVKIHTGENDEVLVNNEEAEKKGDKYLLERDMEPKQITIKREGYKSRNVTVMQYKKSPLYVLSWIPFGILFFPPFMDIGPKAYDYTRELELTDDMVSLPERDEEAKEIELESVSVDLEAGNIRYRSFPSYKNFIRTGGNTKTRISEDADEVKLENTVFSGLLNDLLREKGYIDTTERVLKNSYINNLLISASIEDYTFNYVISGYYMKMIYVDLTIKWKALDYYKSPIYELQTETTSGQFAVLNTNKRDETIHEAIKDAMEYGLIEFMNAKKVGELLHDRSDLELEASFEEIKLPAGSSFVSNLPEAVQASVTIKGKNGHGSGFAVSSEGHIITNYHVVSDTTELRAIMNNGSEYPVEVVRVSKVHDLALLKVDTTDLIPFRIGKASDIELAMDIYTVGTPTAEDLFQTITKGIISGIRDTEGGTKLLQTDASINSGNSGGALVTRDGLVLGVVSSKLRGFGVEGVAFGIPAYEITEKLNISIR